jgi:hypothetical protein
MFCAYNIIKKKFTEEELKPIISKLKLIKEK